MRAILGTPRVLLAILMIAAASLDCVPAIAQQSDDSAGDPDTHPQTAEPDESIQSATEAEPRPQPETESQQNLETEAETAQPPPPSEPPAPIPSATDECFPECRSGFVCHQAQCVSLCNPPCSPDETCSAAIECVPKAVKVGSPEEFDEEPKYIHSGFFLRFTIGPGWSSAERDATDIEMSGGAAYFAFDIGGAPTENLIIHARLSDNVTIDPSVNYRGRDQGEAQDTSFYFALFGVGLTYYFMPVNLYGTFAFGASRLMIEEEDYDSGDSELGYGIDFDLGKEWWVGSEWGLGVAGRFSYASVPPNEDASSSDRIVGLGFGVLFTATYN
jgi:hypothetical protein